MIFKEFQRILYANPAKQIRFILPNGETVPKHYHITDVCSVFKNAIDCSGHTREEAHVHIQLWLGADKEHHLHSDTAVKILQQSQEILKQITDLANTPVVIEYQTEVTGLYQIREANISESEIVFTLQNIQTQCLAALRHEQEKQSGSSTSCCQQNKCCA